MKPTAKKATRRTRADLDLLSIDEVQAQLVAAGIVPMEMFLVDDRAFLMHELPKLESHQCWDMAEWSTRATDPFVKDQQDRFPQDTLPVMWRKQLYFYSLQTYLDALTRNQMMAQLKVVTVSPQFDRIPQPDWDASMYRIEMASRIVELEKPVTTKRRTTK